MLSKKMKIKSNITLVELYLFISTICTSCSLNIPPMDMFSDPDAISNTENARSFLTSAYMACPHYELELSVMGNDFCPTPISYNNIELLNLYAWREKEITNLSANLWMEYYHVIALCDALEERLPKVQVEKEKDKQELINIQSEAKVLKAWCYLQLLKIYAPPYDKNPNDNGIIIKSHLGIENKQRATIGQCTTYIANLLKQVSETSFHNKSQMWLSQQAAKYLLADLYLYMGQWQKVIAYATPILASMPVVNTNQYEDAYRMLFTDAKSNERIFAFYMDNPIFTSLEFDKKQGDLYAVNPNLAIQKNDKRYNMALIPQKINGKDVLLLGKYNKLQKDNKVAPYLNIIRRANLVFMIAEAYAQLNDNNKAVTTINNYRKQTHKALLTYPINRENLIDSILHDKYEEFVGEGVNFFDLKRTHRQPLARLGIGGNKHTANIATNDYRWTFPIPKADYRFNPAYIKQNKGWYYANDK